MRFNHDHQRWPLIIGRKYQFRHKNWHPLGWNKSQILYKDLSGILKSVDLDEDVIELKLTDDNGFDFLGCLWWKGSYSNFVGCWELYD